MSESESESESENKTYVHWNDPAILEAAGVSPELVRGLLRRHGQGAPTEQAVYQWRSRFHIPDRWRSRLVYALLREERITLAKLFRRGDARRGPT